MAIAPYKVNEKTREFYRDEVLISSLNPKNLKGVERKLFNHELIYLNPNYKGEDTPLNYRDWLDLIYESIHSPENPQINTENEGVRRATQLIQQENISPEEWEEAKFEASRRRVIVLEREEERMDIARVMLRNDEPEDKIIKYTGLTSEQIQDLRNDMNR